jgi:thioredoxin reductase (NADPH)
METSPYDVIVIGAGAAGLTAATEAARAGLKVLCLDKLAPGGVLINLGQLHDFEESLDGAQMASRLTDDAVVAGVEIGFGEVSAISGNSPWTVETADGERHSGRALVAATGMSKGKLGVADEERFEGRGLSHCAVCDGPLYAGQPVVVAGAAGWAPHEAEALVGIAGEITVLGTPTVELPAEIKIMDGRIVGLEGADGLQAVLVESDGARKAVPANAVFVYVGQSPAAEFLPESLARDAAGHIVVDDEGRTSVPLVFAAGDVRAGTRQYLADAIADGQRVAKAVVAALKQN